MKRALRILAALAGLVVLVLAGGYVWLQTIDAEDYRAEILEGVREATGRELTIGGALRIGGGLAPALVAEDVALADAPWGGPEPMAEAGRVEIVIRLLPLIVGETVIDHIELRDARIALRRNAEGEANWQFGDVGEGDEDAGAAPVVAGLRARDAQFSYVNEATGAVLEIGVNDLDVGATALFGALDIAFDGSYQGIPLTVVGEVGPIASIFEGGALDLDLEITTEDARLRASGDVVDPANFAGIDLRLDGEGGDLARVNRFYQLDLPVTRSFEGTARLIEAGGVYRLEDIDARTTIGDLDLAGTGEVADIDTFRDFSLQARLTGGDLAVLGQAIDVPLPETAQIEARGRFYREAGRYGIVGLSGTASRPGASLSAGGDIDDLERFAGLDLEFAANGGNLADLAGLFTDLLPETQSFDIGGHVVDNESGRRIEELVALLELSQAQLSFDGRIGDLDRFTDIDMKAAASGEDLSATLAAFGIQAGSAAPFSLDLQISDTGSGWIAEELAFSAGATSLTGYLAMQEGPRPAISGNLESPYLDLDALLGRDPNRAEMAPHAEGAGGRVFPEDPLPFALLNAADLDIGIAISELVSGEGVYREVQGGLRLRGGRLAVEDLRAVLDEGRVAMNIRADAAPERLALDLEGENVDVPAVLGALGIRTSMQGNRGTVSLHLEGEGGSAAALAASLGGRADIVLGPGRLRDWTASVLTSDFVRLLSGGSGDGVDVECVVARFDIAEGVARTDTVLIQTEGARLAPVGTIDLGRERYNLVLYSRSRVPSLATLAVPLRITGPLDDPDATPDPAEGTVDTVGNLLSLATLGLSRDMFGDKVPAGCASAGVEGGRNQTGVLEGTADSVGGAVKDTVRGVGRTIDRIFGD